MLKIIHDVTRAKRWRQIRRKIRDDNGHERYQLLRRFGDEIRTISPLVAKASAENWDISTSLELATMIGVVVGGWASMLPANPDWVGRDRIFLTRREDLVSTCAALSTLGFFPSDKAASLVDEAMEQGRDGAIPGIESPCVPAAEIPTLAWESALESARSKRRWRESFNGQDISEWVDPAWRESPAVWRTCVILDAGSIPAELFRDFPLRGGEQTAGLVAVLPAPRNDADKLAGEWRNAGWESETVNRTDCLGLYDALARTPGEKPLAIILAMAQSSVSQTMTRIQLRRKEAEMLSELPDDQFNALMEETLNF